MTRAYCPACLDTWCIQQTRIDRGDFLNVRPGVSLHVSCGRALEALRTAPPTWAYDAELVGRQIRIPLRSVRTFLDGAEIKPGDLGKWAL